MDNAGQDAELQETNIVQLCFSEQKPLGTLWHTARYIWKRFLIRRGCGQMIEPYTMPTPCRLVWSILRRTRRVAVFIHAAYMPELLLDMVYTGSLLDG